MKSKRYELIERKNGFGIVIFKGSKTSCIKVHNLLHKKHPTNDYYLSPIYTIRIGA